MQLRHERVEFETTRHRIVGTMTLAHEGYRSRISDMLNATERDFIALTDAEVSALGNPEPAQTHAFLALHRSHIVLARPVEQHTAALEAEHAARTP